MLDNAMPQIRLERADDPRLPEYAAVSDPELVRHSGLFVAEGRLVVRRRSRMAATRSIALLERCGATRPRAGRSERQPRQVPDLPLRGRDFLAITGVDIHRGCLALVRRPAARRARTSWTRPSSSSCWKPWRMPTTSAASSETPRRSAWMPYSSARRAAIRLYRKAIRTSMAATLHVPFARLADWPAGWRRSAHGDSRSSR